MTIPSGRLQFFALEAADYLERLALIVGRSVPPDGEELVRLTRALRGAALMAGPAPFAHAAASLEQFAKAYRDGGVGWDPGRVEIVADATEEFQRLVRRAGTWDDADSHASERLAEALNEALLQAGVAATEPRPSRISSGELQPSIRAFVAREAALVAGTLEHAAQAIDRLQVTDAFDSVFRRLQPLRGVGSLPSLVPLPELLDAVELVITDLRDGRAAPPLGSRGLRAAAAALSRLARDVADQGWPDPSAPEPAEVGGVLLATFGREDDVVPIESLFTAGDQAPVVTRGAARALAEVGDRTIELVSVADRLRQASDQLAATESRASQDLQLFALLHQVRALDRAGSSHPLAELFGAVAAAVAGERAHGDLAAFADLLRRSADTIAAAAQSRATARLPGELEPIAGLLRTLGTERRAEPPVTAAADPDPALDDADIVRIESLFPSPAPAAPGPEEWNAFERSFSTLHSLRREPVAIETLLVEPPPPTPAPDAAVAEADVVAIEALLYRGRRALERASAVRAELAEHLNQRHQLDHLDPLLLELMDLVPLALAD